MLVFASALAKVLLIIIVYIHHHELHFKKFLDSKINSLRAAFFNEPASNEPRLFA